MKFPLINNKLFEAGQAIHPILQKYFIDNKWNLKYYTPKG